MTEVVTAEREQELAVEEKTLTLLSLGLSGKRLSTHSWTSRTQAIVMGHPPTSTSMQLQRRYLIIRQRIPLPDQVTHCYGGRKVRSSFLLCPR